MHEGVDGALGRRLDVDEPVMGPDLEMLATVLVGEGAAQHAEAPDAGRERHGAGDLGAGAAHGLDDLRSGGVQATVIEGLQFDADLGSGHMVTS